MNEAVGEAAMNSTIGQAHGEFDFYLTHDGNRSVLRTMSLRKSDIWCLHKHFGFSTEMELVVLLSSLLH